MRVKEIYLEDSDDGDALIIEVDGKHEISAFPLWECPEDAYLHRDLSYVYDITDLMKRAYDAGRKGEEFVYEKEEMNRKGY